MGRSSVTFWTKWNLGRIRAISSPKRVSKNLPKLGENFWPNFFPKWKKNWCPILTPTFATFPRRNGPKNRLGEGVLRSKMFCEESPGCHPRKNSSVNAFQTPNACGGVACPPPRQSTPVHAPPKFNPLLKFVDLGFTG